MKMLFKLLWIVAAQAMAVTSVAEETPLPRLDQKSLEKEPIRRLKQLGATVFTRAN